MRPDTTNQDLQEELQNGFKTNKGLYEGIILALGSKHAPATFTERCQQDPRPSIPRPASSVTTWMTCIIMNGPGEEAIHEEKKSHKCFSLLEQHPCSQTGQIEFSRTAMDIWAFVCKREN